MDSLKDPSIKDQTSALSSRKKITKPDGEKDEMEDEYDEAEGSEGEMGSIHSGVELTGRSPHRIITRKGITLPMLIQDGVVAPGDKMLTMEYMGQKFVGDLLPNGKIRWPESEEVFNSPSSWAIHCKQMVNPAKKSGCGWSSIKYKGKKLGSYKSSWFIKHRAKFSHSPAFYTSSPHNVPSDGLFLENESKENSLISTDDLKPRSKDLFIENTHPAHANTPVTNGGIANNKRKRDADWPEEAECQTTQEEALNLSIRGPNAKTENNNIKEDPERKSEPKFREIDKGERRPHRAEKSTPKSAARIALKYSALGKRSSEHDPNTLVECISFNSIGKVQPFRATISSNCILLIDFHCHLSTTEVVGYLAGKWDPSTQVLRIQQAFPCKCDVGDKDNALAIEKKIRLGMEKRGLELIGWYHSHPKSSPNPSLHDVDSQIEYQFTMKGPGNIYSPCMGLIVSPYVKGNTSTESTFQGFWVLSPIEQRQSDYGIPMQINYSVSQDSFLSQDVYNEMKRLVDFFSSAKAYVNFTDQWEPSWTFLDKLKCSLSNKFPKDQTDGRILDYIDSLLVGK